MSATCASLQSRHHTQFSHGQYLCGLKIDGNLWKQDLGCVVGLGRTVHLSSVIASCVFKFMCGHAEAEFQLHFMRSNSPETPLQGCTVCMYSSLLMVWPGGIMSTRITQRHARHCAPLGLSQNLQSPGAQRLKVHLSTALTQHTFLNYLWLFSNDSFSATRNAIAARCLKRRSPFHDILANICACTKKRTVFFSGAAVASGTFKINMRKICTHFLLILTEVHKMLQNLLGNPRITATELTKCCHS
jgi:hypothetical protein